MSDSAAQTAAVTVEAQAEAQLFDRLKKLKEMLGKLKEMGLNFDVLGGPLFDAVKAAMAAEGTKAQVAAWLHVLEVAASATTTDADDKLVAALKKMADSALVGVIVDLIGGWMGKASIQSESEQQATVEAAALPWTLLIGIAKAIFSLINLFKKPETAAE